MYKPCGNVRAVAARVIQQVCQEKKSLNTELPLAIASVLERDRALLQELCFGVCRWYQRLDAIRRKALKKPLKRKDRIANELILVGLYQIFETRIPEHAALYETVKAADDLDIGWLKNVINGVLRNVLRQKHDWQARFEEDDQLYFSHPKWMLEKIRHNWPDDFDSILLNNNLRPPMTLRVNISKVSRSDYLVLLNEADIEGELTNYAETGIRLMTPVDVERLPGFAEGLVSVQDEAAQLCCDLLALAPGQHVLDACAAPGGKTLAMLEREPSIDITALDHDPQRLLRVEQNLRRMGFTANLVTADAGNIEKWWNQKTFDRILLDAPCSATGVIRRHPDIKLLRQEEDIKQLAETQLSLLTKLWPTLKPGGRLLYATCSIFPQENSRIIARFLKQENSAQYLKIDTNWGIAGEFGIQLLPKEHGHDGFFYACLEKVS